MLMHSEADRLEKLWGPGAIRVFLSHKAEDKEMASGVKDRLSAYSIASFVAHEDIEPMQEWVGEIELALSSMDALVALLTDKFSESNWTDQEVGIAIGRGVPVIPVRLGKDPYGFIGKYQAISGFNSSAVKIADDILKIILKSDKISVEKIASTREAIASARDAAVDNYIARVAQSGSFAQSNTLARYLRDLKTLSASQEEALVRAFNENYEVRCSFDFGAEIAPSLKRLTGHDYAVNDDRLLIRLADLGDDPPF